MTSLSETAAELIRTDPALANEVARLLSIGGGGLTERQAEALAFIRSYSAERGVTPTFSEIMNELGLHSKAGVHRILTALEERGFIERMPKRARAISLKAAA